MSYIYYQHSPIVLNTMSDACYQHSQSVPFNTDHTSVIKLVVRLQCNIVHLLSTFAVCSQHNIVHLLSTLSVCLRYNIVHLLSTFELLPQAIIIVYLSQYSQSILNTSYTFYQHSTPFFNWHRMYLTFCSAFIGYSLLIGTHHFNFFKYTSHRRKLL